MSTISCPEGTDTELLFLTFPFTAFLSVPFSFHSSDLSGNHDIKDRATQCAIIELQF